MGRIVTAVQLEARATRRKAREVFLEAKAKAVATATNLKPYVSKGESSLVYVRSIEDGQLIVKMPVLDSTITKVAAGRAGLGWLSAVEVEALTGVSVVGFKGNHKSVLRIRVNEAKATPTSKATSWGTRVIDTIENSYQLPFSLGSDTSPTMKEAKDAFRTLFTSGALAGLITKKGSYAELIYARSVIEVVR